MDVIGGVLSLLLLVCLAGVVYPFKPFKSRKRAFLLSILVFVVMVAQISMLAASPEFQAELELEAATAAAEARSALEAGDFERAENILNALSDIAADKKPEELTTLRNAIIKERSITRFKAAVSDTAMSSSEKLEQISVIWRDLKNNSGAKRAISSELEPMVQGLVKSIPSTAWAQNQLGYELLTEINAAGGNANPQYRAKVKSYTEKIEAKRRRQSEAVIAEAVQGLTKKYDKVDNNTWYSHPSSPKYVNSRTTAYIYLGYDPKLGSWIRLKTTYAAEDWLFVKDVQAFVDGETFTLTSGGFNRDSDTKIWEWKDEMPSASQLAVLSKMAKGKDVVLRFNGQQYRKDKTVSNGDKQAIARILAAHAALQDTP